MPSHPLELGPFMATATISKADFNVPDALVSFVHRQVRTANHHRGPEQRFEARESLVLPVLAQPVDEAFHPLGEPFTLVTRDISPSGIGLVHFRRVNHRLLAIQTHLADEEVNLVVEVVWQKAMGPFEYIGCRLVARLREFPHRRNASGEESHGRQRRIDTP